ncbi:MAG TPA: hypothetical protein VKD24_02730 [Candidatus Angelobacter sp.]|nr:hypothetical protein [Candidatus Angelobacter sp.]
MSWPINFGTLPSPQSLSVIDTQFQAVAATIDIPCSATGTNAISLTPLVNCPTLSAYTELCGFRFRAAAQSSGPVTLSFAGLGSLPVFLADGVTQAGVASVLAGFQYTAHFSASLGGGSGGFFIENPSLSAQSAGGFQTTPGGRLTFQSGTPVMTTSLLAQQTIYYAPFVHQFVPIYNGSSIQMTQFSSPLSDTVGLSLLLSGSSSWTTATLYDIYVTLVSSIPTLCTVSWGGLSSRSVPLVRFGGMLTNVNTTTARTGPSSTITLQANQGTFLGTFWPSANGQSQWIFGAAQSGGGSAAFQLANYYNKVQVTTVCQDTQAQYTYTSASLRQAGGSSGMNVAFVQTLQETAAATTFQASVETVANGADAYSGIGVNTASAFTSVDRLHQGIAGNLWANHVVEWSITALGLNTIYAIEAGDGTNANAFNALSQQQLLFTGWF